MTVPYPLTWPDTVPRHATRIASKFKTTLPAALKNVRTSLGLFGTDTGKRVEGVVISSDATMGHDSPADPGVAVWFKWDGQLVCIAVDRYPKLQDNLQAIYHVIEARRTEARHGGLNIVRQTFKGFVALPAPPAWWTVLGVPSNATVAQVETAYRELAKTAHPDRGGSADAMARLNEARDAGKAGARP